MRQLNLIHKLSNIFNRTKSGEEFRQFRRQDWWLALVIVVVGLGLRLYPGADHFLWIYDQARDSVVIESIVTEKNVVLIGPQTDYPGLNHGPISYYFLAPFYFLSKGDPNLPGLAMIFLNLSTLLPLGLLVQALFKDRRITIFSLFLFAISYEMVEYSRWIFNFSVSVPFLVWSYYFIWEAAMQQKKWRLPASLLAGLSLGFAIQGELFLLNHVPFFMLFLYWQKKLVQDWWKLAIGLVIGLAPLGLAEIKFDFLGIKTFVGQFLGGHSKPLLASQTALTYMDHLAVTFKHTIGGLSYMMAFWFLVVLLVMIGWWLYRSRKGSGVAFAQNRNSIVAVLGLLVVHSTLFTFHFPDKVFVNTGLAIPLIVLVSFVVVFLWEVRQKLASGVIVGLIVFFSGYQLVTNTANQTPLGLYNFIQTGMLFSQKIEMVDALYEMAEQSGFDAQQDNVSLSVIGTPYGVRTVWATVFRQYVERHEVQIPHWFAYKANGYPGEDFFPTQDYPEQFHFLIIESNQDLLPPTVAETALADQNQATEVVAQRELYGYVLQLRKSVALEERVALVGQAVNF